MQNAEGGRAPRVPARQAGAPRPRPPPSPRCLLRGCAPLGAEARPVRVPVQRHPHPGGRFCAADGRPGGRGGVGEGAPPPPTEVQEEAGGAQEERQLEGAAEPHGAAGGAPPAPAAVTVPPGTRRALLGCPPARQVRCPRLGRLLRARVAPEPGRGRRGHPVLEPRQRPPAAPARARR